MGSRECESADGNSWENQTRVSPGCQEGKTLEQNMKALKSTLSIYIPPRDQQPMDMCVFANAGRNTGKKCNHSQRSKSWRSLKLKTYFGSVFTLLLFLLIFVLVLFQHETLRCQKSTLHALNRHFIYFACLHINYILHRR